MRLQHIATIRDHFQLETIETRHVPELQELYLAGYPAGEVGKNNLQGKHLNAILQSKEFCFGYLIRYREKAVAYAIFTRLRDGVLNCLDYVIDRSHPALLAACMKKIGAGVVAKAGESGFRKLEVRISKENVLSQKNAAALGFHFLAAAGDLSFYEHYAPCVFSIKEASLGRPAKQYFDLEQDAFRIITSYRNSLEVTGNGCTFQLLKDGVVHKFIIDRIAEGCTGIEKADEFRVWCALSSRIVLPSERVEARFHIENLSPRRRSFELIAKHRERVLVKKTAPRMEPGETAHFNVPLTAGNAGIHQVETAVHFGNKRVNLVSAFYVAAPAQPDFSATRFLFPAGSEKNLNFALHNPTDGAIHYRLAVAGAKKIIFRPSQKGFSLQSQKTGRVQLIAKPAGTGLAAAELKTSCAQRNGKPSVSRMKLRCRITDKERACVANVIGDYAILENGQISLIMNLRSGLMHMQADSPDYFHIFEFWNEIGPPFSDCTSPDWAAGHCRPYADIYKALPHAISPLKSTWKNKRIAARIKKNSVKEATIELTTSEADSFLQKEITIYLDSVVRLQTILKNSTRGHGIPYLKVKPCHRSNASAQICLPLDGEAVPVVRPHLQERYFMAALSPEEKRLSENWVSYTMDGGNYSYGMFWEAPAEVDFLHMSYTKLPWLRLEGNREKRSIVFPPYYLWAGEGDWKAIRQQYHIKCKS